MKTGLECVRKWLNILFPSSFEEQKVNFASKKSRDGCAIVTTVKVVPCSVKWCSINRVLGNNCLVFVGLKNSILTGHPAASWYWERRKVTELRDSRRFINHMNDECRVRYWKMPPFSRHKNGQKSTKNAVLFRFPFWAVNEWKIYLCQNRGPLHFDFVLAIK